MVSSITRRTALLSLAALAPILAATRKDSTMAGSAWTNQLQNLIILAEEEGGFSGLFGYNPAPAAGKLVLSESAVGGVDPYGNAYLAGNTTYTALGGGTGPWIAIQVNGSVITFAEAASYAGPYTAYAQINTVYAAGGSTLFVIVEGTSGSIVLEAPGSDGTVNITAPGGFFVNGSPVT
jgi:hypothetical protein